MSYDDKFPPNKWLMKTIMKTPQRFLLIIFGFIALEILGGKFFPALTAVSAMILLCIVMPLSVVMMIWHIVWSIKNPVPPPKYCETCHQRLPYKDDP